VLLTPLLLLVTLLFIWPVAQMMVQSFTDPVRGLDNYRRFFASDAMMHSVVTTLGLTLLGTALCALIGYVYAYTVVHSRPSIARLLIVLTVVPAVMNLLVRAFSLEVLLQDTGLVNRLLQTVGLIGAPITLIRTPFAIVFGMVTIALPLMILPLYSSMRSINPELVVAAQSLGATPGVAFRKVFFPLSLNGLFSGSLIVFITGLGYYIVPQLLGNNASDRFVSQHVAFYIADGQWGFGAAIGVVLLVITVAVLLVASRLIRVGDAVRTSMGAGS